MVDLLQWTPRGLYCAVGDFYLDPWRAVDRAVVSHAHSDHARPGSRAYLVSESGLAVTRERVGARGVIEVARWGEVREINGVRVSLHPAGHILGSAMIRVEHRGQVWLFTGDFKREADPSCEPWEPVRCHTLVTECTFGLPLYRWRSSPLVIDEICQWWRDCREQGRTAVIFAYALGKAQRLLAGLGSEPGFPVGVHGSVERFLPHYRAAGVVLPPCERVTGENHKQFRGRGLVIAPASTAGSPWLRRLGDCSIAVASGWMQIRGNRRRSGLDRGFVLSDHADWAGLVATVRESECSRVLATHGSTESFVRWLRENGWEAAALETPYSSESVGEESGIDAGEEPPTMNEAQSR